MEDEQKILEQKIDSLYEILIGFLIVDGDINESEVDEMMIGLSESLNRTDTAIMPTIAFEDAIQKIANDPENFMKNAQFLYLALDEEEQKNTMRAISNIVFADNEFNDQEYELFIKLMTTWKLEKKDLISE